MLNLGRRRCFFKECELKTTCIFSYAKVMRSLNKGCQGFLASVMLNEGPISCMLANKRVVSKFFDVFIDDLLGLLPKRKLEFVIDLQLGTSPISKALYTMALTKVCELKEQLKELLDKEFIRPSVSLWEAHILSIKQKDGSLQLCVDYHMLNQVTIENKYPLCGIHNLFDKLKFTRVSPRLTLDPRSKYHQL